MADFSDYRTSNKKGFRYVIVIIDNFSKCLWVIPIKNKNSQTITIEFSNNLTTSKQSGKIENNRGLEFHNNIFQNFLKAENKQQYSSFTDKDPGVAERVKRTVRNFLKKPLFKKRNADCLSELPSVMKKYNNTIHHSIKMTPIQASKKSNEKLFYSNLQD